MAEIVRDPETGQFKTVALTTEEGEELSRAGNIAQHGRLIKPPELLAQFGYNDDNPAPPHIQLLARAACKQTGSPVSGLKEFIAQVGSVSGATAGAAPEPGTICPTCGQYVGELDGELLLQLLDLVQSDRGKGHLTRAAAASLPGRQAQPAHPKPPKPAAGGAGSSQTTQGQG